MTTAEDTAVPVAGTETSEVQTQETVQPEATTAQPVEQDPEALRSWAIGEAARQGWTPPTAREESQVEMTPGHPDIPLHPKWKDWEESGNVDAQEAYVGAIKASRAEIQKTTAPQTDRIAQIEAHMNRTSCIQGVTQIVPQGARMFIDKAVAEVEKTNGQKLAVDNPVIREFIALKAEKMWRDTGGDKVKAGETNGVSSQHSAGISQELKDEWLPAFEKSGYPGSGPGGKMTDAELTQELKNMGVIK